MPNLDEPEISGAAIVAIGSFNPSIFHPLWFSLNKLLPSEEAEAAQIEVVHRNVAVFSTDWFSLQVDSNRFCLQTHDATKIRLVRDLALGTFTVLEHTPLRAMGLNADQHFGLSTEEEYVAFGHYISPKEGWRESLVDPRTYALVVQGTREQCDADYIQVKVEPSTKVNKAVFFAINQHYQLDKIQSLSTNERMSKFISILETDWESFFAYSLSVCRKIIASAKNSKHGN